MVTVQVQMTVQVECGDYRVIIRIAIGEDFGRFDRTSVPDRDVYVVVPTLSEMMVASGPNDGLRHHQDWGDGGTA